MKYLIRIYLLSAAWVHRGFSDDVTELNTVQPGGDQITDFQKDKFRHFFFHVLDLNSDCVISSEDFEKLNEVFWNFLDRLFFKYAPLSFAHFSASLLALKSLVLGIK